MKKEEDIIIIMIFTTIFIFFAVLFLYLHIHFHLKKCDDLEMYELDDPSKEKLEEICDLRQPALIAFPTGRLVDTTNKQYIEENYPTFEIKIRNIKETNEDAVMYLPLHVNLTTALFSEDTTSGHYTENNSDFLEETGMKKNFSYHDEFLRPYMVSNCNYDVMYGSVGSHTPFRYEINYRNYFLCTGASVRVKLCPPMNKKFLIPEHDYEAFEFRSKINMWDTQAKYMNEYSKVKCLEFDLECGKMLYVPSYWWYSIKFTNTNSSVSCFRYRTYFNNLAIAPYIFMHVLQTQNVVRKTVKIKKEIKMNELEITPLDDPTPPQNDNRNEHHGDIGGHDQ